MSLERVKEMLDEVVRAVRVETVYGESREVAGKTIIPVAKVCYGGGGGGGQGKGQQGDRAGGGGGLGVQVQPLGCFVITPDAERWSPVVDVTKLAMAGCAVAIFAMMTINKFVKHR